MHIAKRTLLLASAVLIIGAIVALFASIRSNNADSAASAPAPFDTSSSSTDTYIESLQARLQRSPDDSDALTQLGAADLQRARETGNPAFYTNAETALKQATAIDENSPDALRGLASLALARHDFHGGLELALRAKDQEPSSPQTLGVIGDALIELGRYDESIDAYQQMLDLKPNLSSYARVSYVRELYGDVPGAEEAMELAANSGGTAGEGAAWAHFQLGNLYYNHGDADRAQTEYEQSVAAFPGYVHGNAGLAKVKAAQGDVAGAIALYRDVVDRYPVLEYVVALGDLYKAHGDDELAAHQFALVDVIDQLLRSNGVNSDLELALYYADHDVKLNEALRQARAEYQRRPSVQAADILSWALYKNGRYEEALRHSNEARRLGSADALYAFHAGMISKALGDNTAAATFLTRAIDTNPHFSQLYASVAIDTLHQIASVSAR